jgi:hypothetical protein
MIDEQDVARLVEAAHQELGIADAVLPDEYFYASLPLCVIDSVFSINARYEGVRNVIARYCSHYDLPRYRENRDEVPPRANQQSMTELIQRIAAIGSDRFATAIVQNCQRTSPRNGILKSEAALRFARVLSSHRIEYLQDVQDGIEDGELQNEIFRIPGQRSGISLRYFFMLGGSDDLIKPDRMIHRYLERVLAREITAEDTLEVITRAVVVLRLTHANITARLLDSRIWKHERDQEPIVGTT